jgi:membrane-bound metal-dependent hydrolase YbcI (DUF457 family)
MNTPSHVILNGLVLGGGSRRALWLPITAGALVPDLPMVGFYLYQRVITHAPEHRIWNELYFEPQWQGFFDVFNSLPLALLGALLAWRFARPAWLAFFLSVGLHCLADLPLHREDAHGHFFPLSDWRFVSPASYWDPGFHGGWVAAAEMVLVVAGSIALGRRSLPWRIIAGVTLLLAASFGTFAYFTWLT